MSEYSIDKIIEKTRALDFTHKEREGTAVLYWRSWEQFTRHTPKPSNEARLIYNDLREREAYAMCIIRIHRIVDIWHEKKQPESFLTKPDIDEIIGGEDNGC